MDENIFGEGNSFYSSWTKTPNIITLEIMNFSAAAKVSWFLDWAVIYVWRRTLIGKILVLVIWGSVISYPREWSMAVRVRRFIWQVRRNSELKKLKFSKY
jgi:hypothetical protein